MNHRPALSVLLLFWLALLPVPVPAQTWSWATPLFGTGQSRVEGVAALPDGGVLACGEFNDTLRIGPDTLVTHGGWDGFLVRLDATGAALWAAAIGGTGDDELNELVVDGSGHAFAAASFRDTVQWKGTAIPGTGNNATLVKFDLDGNVSWFRRASGNCYAYTVAAAANGMVYLGGVLNASATFSGTVITNPAGIYNAFIVRYQAGNGTLVDAQTVSGSSGDYGAYGMAVDQAGNAYLTGYTRPQQNPYVGTFMRKRAFDGSASWSQTVSSAFGDLYGRDVAVASDGHVLFTGNIYNNVDWMGTNLGQYGRYKNAYLARFATDGTLAWVQQAGSTGEDLGLGVVADAEGNAYWTGCFYHQATFDSIAVATAGESNSQDIFVARSGPAGGVAFVATAGGNQDERATAVDKLPGGPLFIGGQYLSYNCQFGDITLPPGGRCFVAAMAVPDDGGTTGMGAPPAPTALQLHPVPARDHLSIAMPGGRGPLQVQVLDLWGRLVRSYALGAPFGQVPLQGLAEGTYVVRCLDSDGRVQVGRAVVAGTAPEGH
jgi:hypothetical protein